MTRSLAPQSLANKKPFAAPIVDQLSVRVVVDSRYERFLPKSTHPFAKIEHVGQVPGLQMTSLACEWGLSLHLQSTRAGTSAQYMLDYEFTPEIINRNIDLLDRASRVSSASITYSTQRPTPVAAAICGRAAKPPIACTIRNGAR
jgi:hypothetical protein